MAVKLQGFEFWKTTLRGACYIVAPMVDQSELAWRLLSRRHGAELCYTPMLHAQVFVRDANYRRDNLYSEVCPEDRPLITQFCANDPEVFVQACLLVQDYCDAIDLNLGCPQMIAKRGHYGVFLQDEWDLLEKMVKLANEKISVPITCKIRVFNKMEKTVQYAQMLEKAGCQLLTVHGRTKDQKGPATGIASWEHIKAVRLEEITNGGEEAGQEVGLPFPHWICQPYVRPVPKDPAANGNGTGRGGVEVKAVCHKRALSQEDSDGASDALSKNKQKKKARNPHKNFCPEQKLKYIKCEQCGNPKGNKCVFNLCRGCCKKKAYKEVADCPSHGLRFKTKAEKQKEEEGNRGIEEGKSGGLEEEENGTPTDHHRRQTDCGLRHGQTGT
ncbi:tRNA-dihydrouridine(16/17) synthase [NAD(P)(+)]-like [Coregonus clupeaformis]|uniref:tRNA-dihydrouridine(16/17) synthase [NAD(P)(+)]-like n=1 Tax=Coregonus clupeaformis TaxID=59861 RepID=UPI001BE00553|nr:tRNA-dihydrouridine(16/17) synthase [NAD(P)(+)]-like [Coregonus clupeaformis]